MLHFLRNCQTFFHSCWPLYVPNSSILGLPVSPYLFFFPVSLPTLFFVFFQILNFVYLFIYLLLQNIRWNLTVILDYICLMTSDTGLLFMCLLAVCISFLEKCLFESFAQFIIGLSFCCWVVRLLYVFWILALYQIHDLKIFSPPFFFLLSL